MSAKVVSGVKAAGLETEVERERPTAGDADG
jgi:hypothetical protein